MSDEQEHRGEVAKVRRAEDKRREWQLRLCVGFTAVAALAALISLVVSVTTSRNRATLGDVTRVQDAQTAESAERRDQICLQDERAYAKSVDGLTRTYAYLTALTAAERESGINRAIMAQLPKLEADAQSAVAPSFCDEPRVGLPEPNPVIPCRPSTLGIAPDPPSRCRAR